MADEWDWMSPIDQQILEFFNNHDVVINPASLAVNINYDRNYTARRCSFLASHGLLEKLDGPMYRLTEKGRAYLEDELTESEVESANES